MKYTHTTGVKIEDFINEMKEEINTKGKLKTLKEKIEDSISKTLEENGYEITFVSITPDDLEVWKSLEKKEILDISPFMFIRARKI